MKSLTSICAVLALQTLIAQAEDRIASPVTPLSQEEIGNLISRMQPENALGVLLARRGLVSDHMTLRADSARYIAYHGTWDDVPYLIDALSDDSIHVGANYVYAGMATTRYWASVALISICKMDLGYRWDAPAESRKRSIDSWKQQWELHQKAENG